MGFYGLWLRPVWIHWRLVGLVGLGQGAEFEA